MRKRPLLTAFLLTALFTLILWRAGFPDTDPPPYEEGETVVLCGTVENITDKEDSLQICLTKISDLSGFSYQRQVLVYSNQKIQLKIGYRVKVEGKYQALMRATNPGQFDQKDYYEAKGIGMILKKGDIQVLEEKENGFRQGLVELREYFSSVFEKIAGEYAALFSAIILGEKENLQKEQKELYQSGGISHIMAISGLHISLVGMLLFKTLRKWKRSYAASALLSGSFMVVYGIFVGFGVSAKRAILMFLIYLGSEIFGESYDLLSGLSLAGILILLKEPRLLFQCGFQLSFLSVGAMGGIYPLLQRQIKKEGKLLDGLVSGLSVTALTLPCTLYWFFEFMPYGLALNLLVIPLMPVVFLSGALGVLLGGIYLPLGEFAAGPGIGVLKIFEKLLYLAEGLPGSRLILGRPKAWVIAAYYLLLLLGIWLKTKKRWKIPLIASAFFLLFFPVKGPAEITFLDVGQGDGIFLRTKNGTTCLIDGGSSTVSEVGTYRILPFLKSRGIGEVDYLFLTHMDEDHISGARELLKNQKRGVAVKTLCLTEIPDDETKKELKSLAEEVGTEILTISRGTCFREEGFSLTCLYPEKGGNGQGENENSMVLKAEIEGITALFLGDLEGVGEEELLKSGELSKTDLLKVAHHGSKGATTEAFLEKTTPRVSVISCGKGNLYGHPAPELLERLEASGTRIYETDESGAITVEIQEKNMKIQEFYPN